MFVLRSLGSMARRQAVNSIIDSVMMNRRDINNGLAQMGHLLNVCRRGVNRRRHRNREAPD